MPASPSATSLDDIGPSAMSCFEKPAAMSAAIASSSRRYSSADVRTVTRSKRTL